MLLAAAAAAVVAATAGVQEPIAVAPWQNLNGDASLAWLEQGAAETMAADLKKSGMRIVERAQIARALAEVQAKDDVGRAVAAGKIAGARSIVLGSFQKSGNDLRLVARVVDVESAQVQDAAKATGALDDVFALQDRVVAALAQRRGVAPPPPRKKKPSVKAYEQMALSLSAKSDDERRALLEASLRLEPDFVYAREQLASLEARMRASTAASAVAFDARESALLAVVQDGKVDAGRRVQAAVALLEGAERAQRFHALVAAAERVLAQKLPADVVDDVNERASAARVLALARLVKIDLALQAGEKHLAQFPAGARRADVDKLMRDLIERRRSEPARHKDYEAELAENIADMRAAERDKRVDEERRVTFAWKPCIAAKWSKLPDEMVDECKKFLAGFAKNPAAQDHVAAGRAFVAWGYALRGDFADARAQAAALEAEMPGSLDDTGLRTVMDGWSAD